MLKYFCEAAQRDKAPGPSAIGVWITKEDKPIGMMAYQVGFASHQDALLQAIFAASASMGPWNIEKKICLYTRSRIAVHQLQGLMDCLNPRREPLLRLIRQLTDYRQVTWYLVESRNVFPEMVTAAELARQALDRELEVWRAQI